MNNWTQLYLNTPIPQVPKILNDNFQFFQHYLDIFYDGSLGIIVVPIETTGRIKGARGEFVTAVVDNLVVRNQWTNLYENYTTVDAEYYNTYSGEATATRVADPSSFENQNFNYIDVNQPYYKITNDVSVAFLTDTLGQQIQILFDVSTVGSPFNILLDPSEGGSYKTLNITAADSSASWFVLIAVEYDASWGTSWAIKQYGGTYTII